jgi:TatD DNase family protein
MKPEYIDIHSHLTFYDYNDDRDFVLQRMKDKKVAAITIGTTLEDSQKAIKIAEENENVFAIVGFHPIHTKEASVDEFDEMEKLIQHPKCVGVGECGLDYFRPEDAENKDKQKIFFEKQIVWSIKYDKPLMIHCRNSIDDAIDILTRFKKENPKLKANFHFFNGTSELAKRILDLGFQVSFTGIITFVPELEETVKYVPLDKIMSETDSPFASPKPYRGSRNEPTYVIEVVKNIAETKGLDLEDIKIQLMKNAEEFWGLKFGI